MEFDVKLFYGPRRMCKGYTKRPSSRRMIQKILSPTKERDSDNKTEVKIIHGDGQERKDIGGSRRGEGSVESRLQQQLKTEIAETLPIVGPIITI